jgi:uncharacterized surface protein with fasciclin (FAS1) repeats
MKLIKVIFLFLLFSYAGITGCKKSNLEEPPGASVTQVIANDPTYSLLYYALQRTGYLSFTSTTPNITLFAPSNAAFTTFGLPDKAAIDAKDLDTLKYYIGYHLSGRAISASKILASGQLETLSNYIFTSRDSTGNLFLNASPIPTSYTGAANGIIYPVTRVLEPPTQTLQQLIAADTSLSLFARAVAKDTLTIFSDLTTLYTLFAPVNNAFREWNINTIAQVDALGKDSLDKLIKYHVISSSHILTTDFVNAAKIKNLRDSILVTGKPPLSSALAIYAPYQGARYKAIPFLKKDSIAVNGVIYRIGTLLIP